MKRKHVLVVFAIWLVGALIAITPYPAPVPQEQECYEVGEIECVNTSAGWVATWPASQEFRDHMIETIDLLELSGDLNWQQQEFCVPILNNVKGEFRSQVLTGLGIYEFNMSHYHEGVQLQGRHAPGHGHPHYMFNRGRWGLMGTLMMHEVAHHRGLTHSSANTAETCLDL